MPSLRQLRYFTAVANTGSATRAASVLNVSQPSVSAAVRDLEEKLGQRLFVRRQAKGLELTPYGADKVREARDIIARVDALMIPADAAGQLRIALGYFTTLGPTWIPDLLLWLRDGMPQLRIELHEGDLDLVARDLANGVTDCAITYDIGLPPGTARFALAEVGPQALLPRGHPLAAQDSVSLAELAAHDFVLIDLPLSREFLMVPFWQHGLSPSVKLRTSSIEMARQMVARGLGVSLLFTPAGDAAPTDAVLRPLREDLPRQHLVLACDEEHASDPVTAAVISMVTGFRWN